MRSDPVTSPADGDRAIAALLDRGDLSGAATLLIEMHGPGVLGYLRVTLRDRDAADEAFAQSCENIWKGIGSFRGEASFRTWAYRVAWHAALRQIGDPFRRRRCEVDVGELDGLVARSRSITPPYRVSAARDRLAWLRRAMDPEEQTLLTLRLDRQLAWSEIAHILSSDDAPVTSAAVRKRYVRLCEKLRRLLAEDRNAST